MSLQIDFAGTASGRPRSATSGEGSRSGSVGVHKTLRVNGARRRSAEFVGLLKAALFSPEDMVLMNGPPAARRRFMDLLIAQLSHQYLVEWQAYSKTMRQRNHLLRSIREGKAKASELDFWNARHAAGAARIMADRSKVLSRLNAIARPIHADLSGSSEPLTLSYVPSAPVGGAGGESGLADAILDEIRRGARREIASGHSLFGPHRDDLSARIGDMDVSGFASRGQMRTVVLAMKLGEAQLIADALSDQPALLLDDVMSELDPARQRRVMEFASQYEQVVLTTAEPGLADTLGIDRSRRMSVESGRLTKMA